ncbi:hypothetical protein SAMN05421593_1825 [Chryseobacterium culicis]|uniref:Uncharacterized protein n=2 Tax=Chryseobacterium culicis TaxID=680127 RepID=A0A1H6HBN1_CHRCI|nr:hypothetical protein SAMN05421593_1825 [Chryseobacterium culicis]
MFLTNNRKIKVEMRISLFIFIVICCLLACCYLFRFLMGKEYAQIAGGTLVMANIMIIRKIFSLKVFEFENTGAVFSIKTYHPLHNNTPSPVIEYPLDKLLDIKIRRLLFADIVIVDVYAEHTDSHLRFKIKTSNVSTDFYNKMLSSIE